jgi:hypothetical protein
MAVLFFFVCRFQGFEGSAAFNSSMANVNALAPMRTCADSSAASVGDDGGQDTCSVAGSTAAGAVDAGTSTFEDVTIADDAIAKLSRASLNRDTTGQPFFLAVVGAPYYAVDKRTDNYSRVLTTDLSLDWLSGRGWAAWPR